MFDIILVFVNSYIYCTSKLSIFQDALKLLPNPTFIRSVFSLLEVSVVMEIWKIYCEGRNEFEDMNSERPALSALLGALERETNSLLTILETDAKEVAENLKQDFEKLKNQDLGEIENDIFPLNLAGTSDVPMDLVNYVDFLEEPLLEENTKMTEKKSGYRKIKFYQASAAWRAAAGVALCSPNFQVELSKHPIVKNLTKLLKLLAVYIATDRPKGNFKIPKISSLAFASGFLKIIYRLT